jgi:hypothetical protein
MAKYLLYWRVVFMGLVLFIHGMGYDPRKEYWRDWAVPLSEALAQRGVKIEESDFGGIYYYDLVPSPATKDYANFLPERQRYLGELRDFAWHELNLNFKQSKEAYLQTRGVIKKLINYLVDNFGDIFAYLHLDQIYQAVNARVYEKLLATNNMSVYLLGYSLGAMVGHCALQANSFLANRVVHFLMLGNPLFWFARSMARRVDLHVRPSVGRWTNVAGIADIAWPHLVPRLVQGLDEHVEVLINRFNPIRGHITYFCHPESLWTMAGLIAKTWNNL